MADEKDMRELAEAKKLPLPDRIAHTNWKVRSAAYEDVTQACNEIYDDADPRLNEYGQLFAKAVGESNATAVDKALDALAAYLRKATEQHASRICERTCATMVAKCLSARTSTLNRVLEAMLLFTELEQGDKVTEALLGGLSNKNPKVVVAALELIYNNINLFGHRVVTPQPIIKALPALFESKDGKAREKVKEIVVELSRWMGPDAIRTLMFDKMRDAMRDDINRAMEMVEPARQPPRLTRKQQEKAATMVEQAGASGGGAGEGGGGPAPMEEDTPPPEADPYEYAEPKQILKELKSDNFWDKLEEKKWTERRDAVLLLKGLADTPRIAGGDYGDVIRELRKMVSKDSNVVVVAECINVFGLLAKGLRKEFASYARNIAGQLLEKYKEKNSNVGNAVTNTLTLMHKYCWGLNDVIEDVTEAMKNANPKVKEDTYKWLTAVVPQEPKPNMKQLVAPLMGQAAKGAEEATPALREAALNFMCAFTVRFGNTAILEKFCSGMDEARKKKLQDMVAEAMGGGAAAAAPAAAAKPTTYVPPAARASTSSAAAPSASMSLKPRLGGAASRPGTAAGKPAAAGGGAAGGGGPKKAAGGDGGDDEASLSAGTLSKDQAVALLMDLVGEAKVKELQDEQWKTRLEAMEVVLARASDPSVIASSGSGLVQAMSHLPGWGEKNFQVMAKQFEVLRVVAAGLPSFSKRDAFVCINGCIDKLADLKLRQPSIDTLTAAAEAVGPQFVMAQLHKKAAAHKNPKVQSEAINWIARAITEFGIAGCDVKALIDWAKEDLGSSNASVRNAAIQMLGVMHRFLGPPLGDMIRSDVKPALMTAIDSEFAKVADLPKPEPTRVSRVAAAARSGPAGGKGAGKGGGGGGGGGAAAAAAAAFDPDDLLPRTDISGLVTGELVTQLSSANWKERKAGLDAIEAMLTQAGGRIQPQTGDLLPELKKRLADSNKNLTTQALSVLGRIARAMGKAIDRNGRPLLAPAVKNITDQKQTVRSAVTEMLDAWVAVTAASSVMSDVMEFYTSPKITADGKEETLKWLAGLVAGGKVGDCAGDALKAAALGGLDKAAEVRDAAGKLMAALVEVVGPAELAQAAHGLDGSSRKPALDALAKATGAPVPAAAVVSTAASSRPGTAAVRSSTTSVRASSAAPLPKANGAAAPSGVRASTAKLGSTMTKSMSGSLKAAAAAAADEPLIMPDNKKEDRAKKGRFRPSKLQIMPDEASSLEAELSPLLGPALRAAMFHKDFKKHCEAADMVTRALPTIYEDVIAVVDLLFRWCTLRVLESNTASLVKVLELLKALLDCMVEAGYRVSEYEAKLILPALVEKSGHNQDKLKAEHRELLRRFALVHPPVKVMAYVKDGLESKNSKTRVVCLDEIAALVDRTGPSVYRPSTAAAGAKAGARDGGEPVMAAVAKLVTERDGAVRGACLGVIEVVYCIEGAAIWDYLGRLSDQQKSLIEERIKSTGNKLSRQGLQPGYKMAEYGLAPADEPNAGSPPQGGLTPRRPASPMRRSGIGMGVPAAAATTAASPARGGGILDGPMGRSGIPLSGQGGMEGPALAGGFAPSGPVQHSPQPAYVPPVAVAAATTADPAAGYDVRRLSSPLTARFSMNGTSTSTAGGFLGSLDGDSEDAVMSNWVVLHDHLQGEEWEPCIQAMKLLCYSYIELDRHSRQLAALLTDPRNVDELVRLLAGRIEQSFLDAAASTQCLPNGPAYNARACKYSVNALMNLCNVASLAAGLGDTALTSLFSVLLACLIDGRLRQVPDGDGLLKAINMLIMKLLEHANRSGVFGALIGLLRTPNPRIFGMMPPAAANSLPDGGAGEMMQRWNDMVVKCLIKMTKQLAAIIPTTNVGHVLVHIHRYMQELGAEEVRRRSSAEDKPLRMVKTMLHELCKHRGYDIYKDVEAMPGVHESPEEMVMLGYIKLNLETLHFDKRPPAGLPAAATAAAATAAAAASAAPAAASAATVRPRGIPSTATSAPAQPPAAAAPAPAPQVLAPLSTNAMQPAAAPVASAAPKPPAVTIPPAPTQAPAAPAAAPVAATSTPFNLEPSSREFVRPVSDEQEARNILATIFKRIGDKAQSNQALVDLHHFIEANPDLDVLNQMLSQVSPYFKTYLQRGLAKVRQHIQNAAAARAAAAAAAASTSEGCEPMAVSPAPAAKVSNGGGTSGSTWGSPDGEATVAPMTLADKLAAAEGRPQSPSSPGRLRGAVGNLDELRNRMQSLSTNISNLPVRSSASATGGTVAMSQDLSDLQERMKKIQNLGAAVTGAGQPF